MERAHSPHVPLRGARPVAPAPPRDHTLRAWLRSRASLLHHLGSLLTLMGLLLATPLLFVASGGEGEVPARVFLLPACGSLAAGLFLQRGFRIETPSVRDAMLITALGWILIAWVGAVPFVLGLHKSWTDAFFESVSGFTTTGITVFEGLDSMPASLLFWRSLIQWLGGLGILTFFLAVTFRGGSAAAALFGAEGHKAANARPVPGIFRTVKVLWAIYGLFTVAGFVAYRLGGMSAFDALNHTLTTISTGGFSTHDESFGYFARHGVGRPVALESAAIFFMLMGGINFLVHYRVLTGEWRELARDFELRWFWGLAAGCTALVLLDHWVHAPGAVAPGATTLAGTFRGSFFQVASLLTSTGYATIDINDAFFPALSKQIFLVLMLVGGCVGSTAGGIKVLRLALLWKMLRCQIFRVVAPTKAAVPVVAGGQPIAPEELQRVAALLFAWLLLIALGAGITAAGSDLDAWQSLSGMASAVGNMGPFYFSVHRMAGLAAPIKLTFAFGMLAGRLEILPLFVLLSRSAWR